MTYKKFKIILKIELKTLAKEISLKKEERKQHKDGWVPGLNNTRHQFRIKHLACCLLRGTPYDKIESTHKEVEFAKFCKTKADKLVREYKELLCEETSCTSA